VLGLAISEYGVDMDYLEDYIIEPEDDE